MIVPNKPLSKERLEFHRFQDHVMKTYFNFKWYLDFECFNRTDSCEIKEFLESLVISNDINNLKLALVIMENFNNEKERIQ